MPTLRFFIVGSTLHSENPGDLDLLATMPNESFKGEFKITWPELSKRWKNQDDPLVIAYRDKCKGAVLILSQFFDKRHIDFHFVPEKMPYGDKREIKLSDLATLD